MKVIYENSANWADNAQRRYSLKTGINWYSSKILEHNGVLPPHREYILASRPNSGSKHSQNSRTSHEASTVHIRTYVIAKWPHPHVPAYLRLPISPMEMRANNLTDVVVLSFWTLLMNISTTRRVCEGSARLTTPTHLAVVWNACLWTTSPAAAVPGDCGCWASLGW